MGLKGTRVSEEFEYISDRDPAKFNPVRTEGVPQENSIEDARAGGATIFKLGTLRVDLRTKIQDGVMSMTGETGAAGLAMNMNRQHLEAVRFGLKGWENFTDDDDNQIEFKTEKVMREGREYTVPTMDTLAFMQTWLIKELGQIVIGTNSVSGIERKNSNTQ